MEQLPMTPNQRRPIQRRCHVCDDEWHPTTKSSPLRLSQASCGARRSAHPTAAAYTYTHHNIHRESKKTPYSCPFTRQILTDFKKFFHWHILHIGNLQQSDHDIKDPNKNLKCVTIQYTLPCEVLMSENYSVTCTLRHCAGASQRLNVWQAANAGDRSSSRLHWFWPQDQLISNECNLILTRWQTPSTIDWMSFWYEVSVLLWFSCLLLPVLAYSWSFCAFFIIDNGKNLYRWIKWRLIIQQLFWAAESCITDCFSQIISTKVTQVFRFPL